jgi:hypothetical protein
MPASMKRAIVPIDNYRGHRARAGQLFKRSYYRDGVTKLAGITFALILPGPDRDWNIYLSAECENSRFLLYEQATITADSGTPLALFNANRRFELKSTSTSGKTEARLYVDPTVTAAGSNKEDINIVSGLKIGTTDSGTPWILAGEGSPYLITIIPRPQLMTVSIQLEIWEEIDGR